MRADLRLALRSIAKRPLFAIAVTLTLGLGIGVNSGVFSLVNAVLFTRLPVARPSELVNVYTMDSTGTRYGATSYPDYTWIRDHARSVSSVFGYSGLMTTITGNGDPEVIFGEIVTGNYFAGTGARLLLGRGFTPDEDRTPGSHPVVVLGHRLWQRRFGADSLIVGKPVHLNGHPFTVIGVAAPEFNGLLVRGLAADLWAPVMMMGQLRTNQLDNRDERWMFVKGRLAQGMTPEVTGAELRTLSAQLATTYPETNRNRAFASVLTKDVNVSPEADRVLLPAAIMIVMLVGCVLLIASTNLANLMLARAAGRRREIAVRLSLGATRGRLVRQLVTESAVFAIAGAVAGLFVAAWLARLLVAFHPPLPVPISLDVSIDWRVVAFTGTIAAFALAFFGLIPAWRASRPELARDLSSHGDGGTRRKRLSLKHGLLVPQLALSLVLLVTAGLFTRSVSNAGAVDPGFDIDGSAMIALNLALDGYDDTRAAAFYDELKRRVLELPGTRGAAITDRVPLDVYGNQSASISVLPAAGGSANDVTVQFARVGAGYFDALGIGLIRGRTFSDAEEREGAALAVVSREAAQRYWPDADPIGQSFRDGERLVQVIGVAQDVKVQTLGETAQPFIYRPSSGGSTRLLRVVVGTSVDRNDLPVELRSIVRSIDPAVAVFESKTMSEHLGVMLYPYRLGAQVGAVLGLFGLLLAAVGLYGVVAFGVARRTREFGIRMALGARAVDITGLVMRESGRVIAVATAIGLAIALGIARVVSSVLFGVGSSDPITFLGVTALLATVALLAAWLPTRRATRVNPAVALREE